MRAVALLTVLLLAAPATALSLEPGEAQPVVAPPGSDLAAIRETLRLPAATHLNDRDGDRLFDTLESEFLAAGPGATLPVIVTTQHDADVRATLAAAQELAGGFEPRYVYERVGGWAADLNLAQATAVAGLDGVRQVEWSQPGAPELDTATYHSGADAVVDLLGVDGNSDGIPAVFTGKDTVIAILDTGFDGQHADLKGKFVTFVDWSDGGRDDQKPYDSGSHGTHVAGIAAGTGAGQEKYRGVAPGAAIAGYLISSADTKGAAIASIEHILANPHLGVRVLTISFGFGLTVDGTDALELAMDKAWEAGIVNFKSTGNSGPERGTVTVPGGARGIIATASLHDPGENGFHLSGFSSRGPTADGRLKPDIAAPGSNIMAAEAGSGDGYVSLSGTSMASPHAAGVAALMLDADPGLSPDEVREVLVATAQDWGPEGHDVDYGHGRIDALAAVQRVLVQKAVRERWAVEDVLGLNVSGPDTPRHQALTLGAGAADDSSATYDVEEPGEPLAATFILDGNPTTPAGAARVVLVRVEAPSGASVDTISLAPTTRQQVVTLPSAEAGTYTLHAINLLPGEALLVDVSAGLAPPPGLTLPTPEGGVALTEEVYAQVVGTEGPEPTASVDTPGVGLALLLAGLAVATRSRRR